MARVICDMSMSLDGYVTGPHDSRENPFGDGGWGDGGPLGDIPCFVVTHHEPTRAHPSIFTFVTGGVASAIEQAKEVAATRPSACTALATPAVTHLGFRVLR